MRKRTTLISTLALLSLATASAMADVKSQSPNYNAVEISYANTEYDDLSEADVFGPHLKLSFALSHNLYMQAEYQSLSGEAIDVDFEARSGSLMMGYHNAINRSTDYYLGLSYEYSENKIFNTDGALSNDIDGLGVTLGIQGFIDTDFLMSAAVKHIDTRGDSVLIASVGGQYFLSPHTAFVAQYNAGDDKTAYHIGLRYQF